MPITGLATVRRRVVVVLDLSQVLLQPFADTVDEQVVERGGYLELTRPGPASAASTPRQRQNQAAAARFRTILAVPLQTRGECYGALTLYFPTPNMPPPDELALIATFADQAGLAIQNARLHAESERRGREIDRRRQVAEGLRELLAIVNSGRALDQMLAALLAQAEPLLQSDASAIHLLDDSGAAVEVRAIHGACAAEVALRTPLGVPVTGLAALSRRPVAFTNMPAAMASGPVVSNDEMVMEDCGEYLNVTHLAIDGIADPDERLRLENIAAMHPAMLSVPLLLDGQARGTMTLFYAAAREFEAEEVRLAMAFADQSALAIENAGLRLAAHERTREAEQRVRELQALYAADEVLHRSLQLDRVLGALVDVAVDLFQVEKAGVFVWDADRKRLVVGAARGLSPELMAKMEFVPGEGAIGGVAASGQARVVENVATDPLASRRFAEAADVRAALHVPITLGDEIFGVFTVGAPQPRPFSEAEQRLLESLAQRAGLTIENARLYEQAQRAATLQERQRLARELHDAVTQTLFSTALIAEVVPHLWETNPAEGRRRLGEIQRLTRGALAEMRTLLVELRSDALAVLPLPDLLRQLGEGLAGRTGQDVQVAVTGEPSAPLPAEVHVALYRVTQEALNNVLKHAAAHNVRVDLGYQSFDSGVTLTVADDGRGFDPSAIPPGHLGVGIMHERAEAIGALLEIDSAAGGGTRVTLRWGPGQLGEVRESTVRTARRQPQNFQRGAAEGVGH